MVSKISKVVLPFKICSLYILSCYLGYVTLLLLILVSLDPDDEKLLEEEPVNLPDKKRFEFNFFNSVLTKPTVNDI